MSKKKRFGISEALTRGFSETINVVENNAGVFRNIILPLSRIELDPENPRKMAIDLTDIRLGIRADDPLSQQKSEELERLKELAHTIKTSGIINPIVVYKRGESYRIVAGERRCLASILAGKQEIEARSFNEKPKNFELKLMQWIENTAREDLSLNERLENMREIIKAYQLQHGEVEITASLLKKITGLSLSQTTYYLQVLQAPVEIQAPIKSGQIRNLDKAALIASIASPEMRSRVLEACLAGSSLKEMRALLTQQKILAKHQQRPVGNRGRVTAKVNLGSTAKTEIIKTIIDSVLSHRQLTRHAAMFAQINWQDMRQVAKAFRQLVEILEVETSS